MLVFSSTEVNVVRVCGLVPGEPTWDCFEKFHWCSNGGAGSLADIANYANLQISTLYVGDRLRKGGVGRKRIGVELLCGDDANLIRRQCGLTLRLR